MESHLKNMHHIFKVIVMFTYSFTGTLEKWSTNSKLCILVNAAALTIWTEWLILPVSCLFLVFQLLYESFKVWVTDLKKMFCFWYLPKFVHNLKRDSSIVFYRLLSLTHYSLIWRLCSLKSNYCSTFWKLQMLRFLFLTHAHKPHRGKTQKTTAVPVLFCNAGLPLGTINACRNYVHSVFVEIVRTKLEQWVDPPITQPKLLRVFALKLWSC